MGTRGCGSFLDKVVDRARANGTPLISIPSQPMLDFDAHVHAFEDDRTARASLDRITRAKEHWRAYVQGIAELQLTLNKIAIERAALLSIWQAQDRASGATTVSPAACSDCRARHLEHFYTSRTGGSTMCAGCFQSRVTRGVVQEADAHHP